MTEGPQRVVVEVQPAPGLKRISAVDSSMIASHFGRPLVTQSTKLTSATPSAPTSGTRQIAERRLSGACTTVNCVTPGEQQQRHDPAKRALLVVEALEQVDESDRHEQGDRHLHARGGGA